MVRESLITSFEIARPVDSGLEKILLLVRTIGRRTIHDDMTVGIALPGRYTQNSGYEPSPNVVGVPRFRDYKKIRVPIIQYVAETGKGSPSPDFHGLVSKMQRTSHRQSSKFSNGLLDIPNKMRAIAAIYGDDDPESYNVRCRGFSVRSSPAKNGFELVMNIIDNERLLLEADVYNSIFNTVKAYKPCVREQSNSRFNIPLASLRSDVNESEQSKLISGLEYFCPDEVKVRLGAVEKPFVHDRIEKNFF